MDSYKYKRGFAYQLSELEGLKAMLGQQYVLFGNRELHLIDFSSDLRGTARLLPS